MSDLGADAALAAELVRSAGKLAARMRLDGLTVERKSSRTDVVSDADRAAEALIVERLRSERPDDGLVGEEGARADGGRTWLIDPVDGTYNFVSGLPLWCSALALTDGPWAQLGAVYHPAEDELWLGGLTRPGTLNGTRLARLPDRPIGELSLATYLHPPRLAETGVRDTWLRAIAGAATVRSLGSGSLELAAVASGRLGAFLAMDAPPWDWMPGAALVQSVGGATEVVSAQGHRWHVAGCARAVAQLAMAVSGRG